MSIFEYKVLKPLQFLGIDHRFFNLHIDTLIYTWIAMACLFTCGFVGLYFMKKKYNPVGVSLELAIQFFVDLCNESLGYFKYEYFSFIACIFFFTLFANMVGLLPFVDEATKDLNTAVALALSSFFYVQYQSIKKNGIVHYLKDFVEPVPFLLPLEVIGKLASIVSMSFRLFGNILGGSIVFVLLVDLFRRFSIPFMLVAYIGLAIFFVVNKKVDIKKYKLLSYGFTSFFILIFFLTGAQLFFGVFEGFVQAFVLTMLTVTYLAVAVGESKKEETGNENEFEYEDLDQQSLNSEEN